MECVSEVSEDHLTNPHNYTLENHLSSPYIIGCGMYNDEGSRVGEWTWYDKTSRKAVCTGYYDQSGKKDGLWRIFTCEGNLACDGTYRLDEKHGAWNWYDPQTFNILKSCSYLSNHLYGEWELFNKNGQRDEHGMYVFGKKEGEWSYWYKNGDIRRKETYTRGKLDGPFTEWYPNEILQRSGFYKNGERVGEWAEWPDEN